MAILKIARLGHPILRQMAQPVPPEGIGAPVVQRFIDDLIETMYESDGVGLAAPQVHESVQIVAYCVDANPRYPDAPAVPLSVLINPRITPLSAELEEDWEGCLSVPDLRGKVPRAPRIEVAAYDRNGRPVQFTAADFHARVIQHECDHLVGKVFLDRMRSFESLSFLDEFARFQRGARAET